MKMSRSSVIVEVRGRVGLIKINRPDVLNALDDDVIDGISDAVGLFESNDEVGCIVITGDDKAFAAGADVGFMKSFDYMHVYKTNFVSRNWERLAKSRKPVVGAVAGFALGGGCELAMMCDIIIAAENAKFGQPEVQLGIPPGAGGTQRLTRAIGKAKAMDLCLTARMMDAFEAEKSGLVARVVPLEHLLDEAISTAQTIASFSLPVTMMIKESVNRAFETSLAEGLLFERRLFHSAFGLEDQKEGMGAFLSKRKAVFKHR